MVWRWTYKDIDVEFPPLHATWDPRFGSATLPAIAIGLALWLGLPRLAERLSWRALLVTAFASTWIWTMALAMTEGKDGLARVFERRQEYVYDAQHVTSISHMMHTFIDRIPLTHRDNWHVHVAGHPPGALLFFVLLDRLGVTGFFSIGAGGRHDRQHRDRGGAITLRTLGSTQLARGAMPWIVLAPSAVWMGVTGDAMFTAVAAWGLALLAIAATSAGRRRVVTAVGAGLLLGLCVYLSYGLVLLGFLAVAVLLIARTLAPVAVGARRVRDRRRGVHAAGFSWWKAYPVLVTATTPASRRTARTTTGCGPTSRPGHSPPASPSGRRFRRRARAFRQRNVVAQLAAAALLTIGFAAISGMSKAETERIFLPFTIWIVALPMLLPARWHRPLLLSQVVIGLGVEQLLLTRW